MTATTDTIHVRAIENPFRRRQQAATEIPYARRSLSEIVADIVPDDLDVHVAVNGLPIPEAMRDQTIPRVGDYVAILPVIRGGDDDKGILSALAMLAVIIAAPYAAGGAFTAGWGFSAGTAYTVGVAALTVGGGLLVNSLLQPELPKATGADLRQENSQQYGWNPHTTQSPGISVPRVYGTTRVHGNMLATHSSVSNWSPYSRPFQTETLDILIGLSEGPVEGIVSGSMKINGQPIANFPTITTEEKVGELAQTATSAFATLKIEYHVNRLVTNTAGAETYTTPGKYFDDLEIQILFPQSPKQSSTTQAAFMRHNIDYTIEIREVGGSWSTLADTSTGGYPRLGKRHENFIASNNYEGGSAVTINYGTQYEIRVTKTSSDMGSLFYHDEMRIGIVREVVNTAFRYPMQALVAISAIATEDLQGTLDFSCELEGRIIYDLGTSTWIHSSCPASVLYDILTQPVLQGTAGSYSVLRYDGMNPSRIDTAKFVELATMCATSVDDGNGGTENMITFDGIIDAQTTVWEAALRLCEICRCMLVWDGYDLTLAIDKSTSPSTMYTVGNIVKDKWERNFISEAERASEIEISYRDSTDDYKRTTFTVHDRNLTSLSHKVSIDAFGFTKESQAWRHGKYRLNQNRLLKDHIAFGVDIDGLSSEIGDVAYVQHSVPDWQEGGRVVSATANTITVDKTVTASGTDSVLVRVYNPVTEVEEIEDKTVASVSGKQITISGTWTTTPSKDDVWAFGPTATYKKEYRIIGITADSDQRALVQATNYDSAIYDTDNDTPELSIPGASSPGSNPINYIQAPPPSNIWNTYPALDQQQHLGYRDIPDLIGIQFLNAGGGKVGWTDGTLIYQGQAYAIAAEGTGDTNKYIYFDDSDPTTFQTSNTQADGHGQGKFILCVNDNGIPRPVGVGQPYWGEMLIAQTLAVISAQVGDLLGGTLTGSQLTGGIIRTATSGKRIQIDSDGLKMLYSGGGGLYGTTGNGGSNLVYGTVGSGGSGAVYGAGMLASINHPNENVPFYVYSETDYGEIHHPDRSSAPSGAAEIGDVCAINGQSFMCTAAGTPGTWEPAVRYVDRGDPSAYDKTTSDFTKDATWRDLDLSSIVGSGKRLIHLRVEAETTAANQLFGLRENANSNAYNRSGLRTQVADVRIGGDMHVMSDSSGVIEYYATSATWTALNLIVRGWWEFD